MLWQKVILCAILTSTLLAQVLYVDNDASTNPLTVCGPDEFPARMLETDYEQYMTLSSNGSRESFELNGTHSLDETFL